LISFIKDVQQKRKQKKKGKIFERNVLQNYSHKTGRIVNLGSGPFLQIQETFFLFSLPSWKSSWRKLEQNVLILALFLPVP
jgi:hypothetical protein